MCVLAFIQNFHLTSHLVIAAIFERLWYFPFQLVSRKEGRPSIFLSIAEGPKKGVNVNFFWGIRDMNYL